MTLEPHDPDSLVQVLDETRITLQRLVETLEQEYLLLKQAAASKLMEVLAEKNVSLARLAELEMLRERLLNSQCLDDSKPSMGQLLKTCKVEDAAQLRARLDTVATLVDEAHRLNQRNGAVINLTRTFVQTVLVIWRGEDPTHGVYGSNAQPCQPAGARSIAEV